MGIFGRFKNPNAEPNKIQTQQSQKTKDVNIYEGISVGEFCKIVEGKGACAISIDLDSYAKTWQEVFTYFLYSKSPRVKRTEIIEKITTPLTTCRKCNYKFSSFDIMHLTGISQFGFSPLVKCPQCGGNEISFSLML